jgi:hypothetical protein
MTHLKNTYGLKAIPSEKILKEFKPARGMRFRGQMELPPEDLPVLMQMERNQMLDPKAWKGARVVADVTPIFALIAEHMGYDLPSLLEGKGETGKPDDSWTVYADEGKAPMLIRWTIGKAQLLMSIATLGESSFLRLKPLLEICLLSDRSAKPHLAGIAAALRRIEKTVEPDDGTDVVEGNTLRRVLNVADSGEDFTVTCVFHAEAHKGLSAIRATDHAELANSCNIIIEEAGTRRGFAGHLLVDEMSIVARQAQAFRFRYEADRPVPADTLKLVHYLSVKDVRRNMEAAFLMHLQDLRRLAGDEAGGSLRQEKTPELDLELAERHLRLQMNAMELAGEGSAGRGRGRFHVPLVSEVFFVPPTLGGEFRHCPPSTLRGTGPELKMSGGDVETSWDLLDLMLEAICEIPKEFPANRATRSEIKLTASIEAPAIAEQYRDANPVGRRYERLTNPFFAVHHGLVVRVDRTVSVWRSSDTEALAADFFYAPETKDLHVANLYRVKIPKG